MKLLVEQDFGGTCFMMSVLGHKSVFFQQVKNNKYEPL